MNNATYDIWVEMVQRVAKNVGRDHPNSETEDLEQTLWLKLLEALQKKPYLTPDTLYMESTLYYIARKAAMQQRQQHLTLSDQYSYRTKDVRKLLPYFFSHGNWSAAEVPDEEITNTWFTGERVWDGEVALDFEVEYDHDTRLVMMSDISAAWDKLPDQYRDLMIDKFVLGVPTDSKKLSAAIARLADLLNTKNTRAHSGPGKRRAISNSQAVGIVKNYDER